MSYWPWWAGALALGGVAVGYARLSGRLFGVSGSMAKAARPAETRADDAVAQAFADDPAALEAALLAATAAEFGACGDVAEAPVDLAAAEPAPSAPLAIPWTAHVLFLVMIGAGALLASLVRGSFSPHLGLGPVYEHVVAGGWRAVPALAAGGFLVGAGTRMAGGCTSGHGLSGCGRFVPASLAATAIFFGVGVATSLALAWGAR
jgi:uncharacterized membrane protein YedE/YeeE